MIFLLKLTILYLEFSKCWLSSIIIIVKLISTSPIYKIKSNYYFNLFMNNKSLFSFWKTNCKFNLMKICYRLNIFMSINFKKIKLIRFTKIEKINIFNKLIIWKYLIIIWMKSYPILINCINCCNKNTIKRLIILFNLEY
jgi:hypothetical protein